MADKQTKIETLYLNFNKLPHNKAKYKLPGQTESQVDAS